MEIKWDIKRGAGVYRGIYDIRLKNWIFTGKIKQGETLVWRSGFSGWRKPEELSELQSFFKHWEKRQLKLRGEEKKQEDQTISLKRKIKNVLVIDDEKDLTLLLSEVLSHKKFNVLIANTKKDAIACVKKNPLDLVFLDLKLLDGDGMNVLSKIKKINPKIIVNIISAYGGEEKKEKAKQKGAYRFIDKPFTGKEILRSMRLFQQEINR